MDKAHTTHLLKAMESLAEAWNDAGSHPKYHRKMQDTLREEWPTLAKAVERVVGFSNQA